MLSVPAAVSAQNFSDYRIASVQSDAPSAGLRRTRFKVNIGSDALNTIEIVRVRRPGVLNLDDAPVILLSPFGFQTKFWEMTTGAYNDSFVARVARAGY